MVDAISSALSKTLSARQMLPTAKEIFEKIEQLRFVDVEPSAGLAQSVIISEATYAPWLQDQAFLETFGLIKGNTLVDFYRCYELWQLVRQLAHVDGDILEVGVFRGGTGCLMARAAHYPDRTKHVYLCDTYEGIVKAGPEDSFFMGDELRNTSVKLVTALAAQLALRNTSVELVKALAEKLALSNVTILKGIFPDDTAAGIADKRFALCHIDVDVYRSAAETLDWVWPRLNVGGIVVFDDYGFSTCDGVTKLVNERMGQNVTAIYNLNGHAIMVKVSG
jgi:O-methyltransferase